jgi:aryl-alcohol dehydrogenase-like predicted oxidoreductase
MEKVPLGKTGLEVSRLGVGLAEIGYELSFEEISQAGEVLNSALDSGINFLDTAACYSISEELIGRTISHRRADFVLATKAGHVADAYKGEAWSYQTVADSVDRSLKRLNTDHLDIIQLHSCGIDVLERGDAIRALQDAKAAGKLRHVSYSGDNEDAHWAVDSGLFDTLQTSFNLTEQGARTSGLLEKANKRGMGVIIKRPIGGGTWARARRGEEAARGYDNEYLRRAKEMASDGPLPEEPADPILLALGFTLSQPEVNVAIVGTKNPAHMASNIRMANEQLPVSGTAITELQKRWDAHAPDGNQDWKQLM